MTDVRSTAIVDGSRYIKENIFAVGIVSILLFLFVPIPAVLVDIGIAISIAISIVILMLALWINRPLEFSVFPTILLVATMLRLALNIATTRLILSDGAQGITAAGNIIGGVSNIVMAGDFIIGLIVFMILVTINFIVITKGATRIAEVGARFTLDGIPGKQMAIDADLSAGMINETEAQSRRRELEEESAFFGAMDGASKFVRGDAIAGIVILLVNIFGGILIGVLRHEMTFSQAADVFTKLSIGDGLVAQIPALIVSLAAGLLVSKGGARQSAEKAIADQFGGYPQASFIASGMLLLLGLTPGMPFFPFALLSGCLFIFGRASVKSQTSHKEATTAVEPTQPLSPTDDISADLHISQLELVMGRQISLLVYGAHDELMHRVSKLRRNFVREYGFLIPEIRLTEDFEIASKKYNFRVHGSSVGEFELRPGELLVVVGGGERPTYPGELTKEPAFGLDAMWVPEQLRSEVVRQGYRTIDPISIVLTHISEIVRNNLAQLLSYRDLRKLVDQQEPEYRKLIDDLIPNHISYAALHGVLKGLLSERISIRNFDLILEAIAEVVPQVSRIELLVEHVRSRLAAQISSSVAQDGVVNIVNLSHAWELLFLRSLRRNERGDVIEFDVNPETIEAFRTTASEIFNRLSTENTQGVLVVSPEIRPYVRLISERIIPNVSVLSHIEIAKGIKAKIVATLEDSVVQ